MSPDALRRALGQAPKRTKIGAMRSVRIHSDILFSSAPDRPHELTFSAAFPGRSRLAVRPAGSRPSGLPSDGAEPSSPAGLSERYQLGKAVFGRDVVAGRPPAASRSYGQTGAAAVETRLDFALRRCAFFWPDEGQFQGSGWSRTAQVDDLGVLLIKLDQGTGLPQEIRAIGAGGKTAAKLTSIDWQEIDGRRWPKSFEFWAGGSKVWTETVTGIEREWLLGDPWFLPSDRVGEIVGRKKNAQLRLRVRGASQVRSLPVERGLTAEKALQSALSEWRAQQLQLSAQATPTGQTAPPPQLSPAAALVLGPKGEILSIELELPPPGSDVPIRQGWAQRAASSDWVYLLDRSTRGSAVKTDLAKGLIDGQALLESTDRAAAKHGPVRLRFDIVDRGPAGLEAAQKRLTRAAQADAGSEPTQGPPGPDAKSQRR